MSLKKHPCSYQYILIWKKITNYGVGNLQWVKLIKKYSPKYTLPKKSKTDFLFNWKK